MIVTIADQYLAQNAGRRYPLADDTDTELVADNAILDFRCSVRGIPAGNRPYAVLKAITAAGSGRTAVITVWHDGLDDDDDPVATLSFAIPGSIASATPYTATATSGTAFGELTVSSAILGESGDKGIRFAANTVTADAMKVDSVTAVGCATEIRDPVTGALLIDPDTETAYDVQAALSGAIVLDNGYNTEPYLDSNSIRLDIFKGAGVGERCQTASTGQSCENVLFSINGERPGSDGEIRIVGKSGVIVNPKPNDHAIEITLDEEAVSKLAETCEATC